MPCCLMVPNYYLTKCWLIINKIQWHSSESNFTRDTSAINHAISLKITNLKFQSNLPGDKELNICLPPNKGELEFSWKTLKYSLSSHGPYADILKPYYILSLKIYQTQQHSTFIYMYNTELCIDVWMLFCRIAIFWCNLIFILMIVMSFDSEYWQSYLFWYKCSINHT